MGRYTRPAFEGPYKCARFREPRSVRYFLNTESLLSEEVKGSIPAHLILDVLERGPLRREAPSECLGMNLQCDGDIIEL